MSKIIVAGGGHGGIACASILASVGYDVTVYEKCSEGKLGHDWTDIFAPKSFDSVYMPLPPKDKYRHKENMTFYSTSANTALVQNIPEEKLEIQMERRDIYDHIISIAKGNSVKFVYDCEITAPIMLGSRVVGIKTNKGDFYGDLVIDACGIDSPVKNGLPEKCNVNPEVGDNNQFFVYRAFFNKAEGEATDRYKISLFPEGKKGISWIANEENHTDLLIGRFDSLDMAEVERTAEAYRQTNPILGTKVLRGGQFVKIPVRQPLSKMICDGYAAIGDSAYMTVPIIGSGIANCFKAARILADTILQDSTDSFDSDTLWNYQVKYYQHLGNSFAVLACLKEALILFTPDELDYLFDNGIITAGDMSIDSDCTSLTDMLKGGSLEDAKTKVIGVVKDPVLLKKILRVAKKAAGVIAATTTMPKEYNKKSVEKWVSSYEKAIQAEI